MTKQFSRLSADATAINIAPDARHAIAANADFAIGWLLVMNGDMTVAAGSGTQQGIFWSGSYQEAGGIVAHWFPTDGTGSNPGKLAFNINGSTSSDCVPPLVFAPGKAYICVLQRSGGTFKSKVCEVTTTQPTDGAAVVTGASKASAVAFTFPDGWNIGYGTSTSRRLDQSLGRLFVFPRALTDFEIAQLAWGKEITAFGAPSMYLRLNDLNDYADTGTQANTVTATGTIAPGADAPFGFSSVPVAPSFPSKPMLAGAAVVGQAIGYTEGVPIGNPAPDVTHQWTIASTSTGTQTNIAGATNPTYTPVAGDAGKYLRLKLTADNDVEPNATSTTDPSLVSSTAVSLTLTSIEPEAIYQREAGGVNGQANVPLSGAFEGATPAKIEAQLYNFDGTVILRPWFDVLATFDGTAKTWSASPLIDAPTDELKYRITVRSVNSSGVTLAPSAMSGRFGVGDRIIVIGSSSPATWFGDGSGFGRTPDHNKISTHTDAWALYDQYGQASLMAQYIASKSGVPTAIIGAALGGSSLAEWSRETGSGEKWSRVKDKLALIGPKLAGLIGSAGSNDVIDSNAALTVQAHLDKLNAVRDLIRRDTGNPNLPILWSGINRRYDALPLQANNARQAEREFGEQANIYYVQTLDIEVKDPENAADPGDGVHPTATGYATCCRRIEYVWTEGVIYGRKQRGPVITNISFQGTRATITVQHRNAGATDITGLRRATSGVPAAIEPVSSVTGFEVTDDDGAGGRINIPILSVERADPTRITLTCDRTLVNPKITYLEGAWVDNAVALFDNGTTALPLMADPIGLSGNGAVFIPVSNTLTLSYSIAAADGAPPGNVTQTYAVSNTMTITYDIAAAPTSVENFTPSLARTVTVHPDSRAFTAGSFWKMDNPKKPVGIKDPQSVLDITFDWGPWLADIGNPSIASATFSSASALTRGTIVQGSSKVTIMVSGGSGGDLDLTSKITTNTNPARTEERTVVLRIEER